MQVDGDLWEIFARAVNARGPWSIAVTKVKGHATAEEVENGKVQEEDKKGNDKADDAATCGKQTT